MTIMNANIEDQNLDYDAEVIKEEIVDKKTKSPSINIQKDYEESKKFSTPDHELSAEEISPSLGSSFNPDNKQTESSAEGNPDNFLSMAQEIKPHAGSDA
jgi:hypothetical protein